jgi:ferric-dicitrate binding protein FerR (iron transport regulator)
MSLDPHRLHHLFAAHTDGTITPDEHAELQAALRASASARRLWFLHQDVEEGLLGLSQAAAQVSSAKAKRSIWFEARPALAAAAVILLSALTWLLWPVSHETGLVLASADAVVKVQRDDLMLSLSVGAELQVGDVIVTEQSGIVVSYPEEETRLELAPATRLEVLAHQRGKHLRLLTGSLSAEVAPQPEGRPMRLFSSEMEAVVLGTRFTLNASKDELEVQKGAVRVNRSNRADSIVVSAQERVSLRAKSMEIESLPPPPLPRWRDEHTLAFDFESEMTWPVLRNGRIVPAPDQKGHSLTGELVEVTRRHGDKLVLANSLRPHCQLGPDSQLKLRYWAASGIESIEIFAYVFGFERAFKATMTVTEHDRWVEWQLPFRDLRLASDTAPPSVMLRSLSIHTSPVSGPLPFFVDDVVIEHVSPPVSP